MSDKLIKALERNTKANHDNAAAARDLSNSINDLVVVMESAPEWDEPDAEDVVQFAFPGNDRTDN